MYFKNLILDSDIWMKIAHWGHMAKKLSSYQDCFHVVCVALRTCSLVFLPLAPPIHSHWAQRLYVGMTSHTLKQLFKSLEKVYKYKSIPLTKNNWHCLTLRCPVFYRCLFNNGGLWGKCFLGRRGFFYIAIQIALQKSGHGSSKIEYSVSISISL